MSEPMRMVPMGGRSPEDVLPTVMRRLCILRYRCHLCGQDHETQQYISAPVKTMREYRQQVKRIIEDEAAAAQTVAHAAIDFHQTRGDLAEAGARALDAGFFPNWIYRSYQVTNEDRYTCANCQRVFPSNQKLTAHVVARECR